MKKWWNRSESLRYILMSLVALALYGLSMHDRMTAQGVGLYMALKLQREDRAIFDFGAEAARMLFLLLLVLLPCVLLKRRNVRSFSRLLFLWFGLLPFANGATWVHILFEPRSLFAGTAGAADRFWNSGAQALLLLQCWIPLLILLLLCQKMSAASGAEPQGGIRLSAGAHRVMWCVQGAAVVLLFLLPELGEIWKLLLMYPLLVETFSVSEELCEKNARWNDLSFWLFGLFWLRGLYRMLEVLSTSKL